MGVWKFWGEGRYEEREIYRLGPGFDFIEIPAAGRSLFPDFTGCS